MIYRGISVTDPFLMGGAAYVTAETLAARTTGWLSGISHWSRCRELPFLDCAALLVVDLQDYFFNPQSHAFLPALSAILPNIHHMMASFKKAGRPVVLTQHGNSNDIEVPNQMRIWWHDELRIEDQRAKLISDIDMNQVDRIIVKAHYSAFRETELAAYFREKNCNTIVICGVMTHLCCETSAREAFMLNFSPVMVADGCASQDEELHVGSLRNLSHGFAVVSTADQVCSRLVTKRCETVIQTSSVSTRTDVATHADVSFLEHNRVKKLVELAIIGAGPGGIAAAIHAKRCGVQAVLIDHQRPGGQARAAEWIENYPGFPCGITGQHLMDRFIAHAKQFDVELWTDRVLKISKNAEGIQLHLASYPQGLVARAVIVATGTRSRTLAQLVGGRKIYTRADAVPSFDRQHILVVGGGEAAFDQALFAKREGAADVAIAIRGSRPRAMRRFIERARAMGIALLSECEVTRVQEFSGEGSPLKVHLKQGTRRLKLTVDIVLVCVGKIPWLPECSVELSYSDAGIPQVDRFGRTSHPGIYFVGDNHRGRYRQIAIAVGDGVAAAMQAADYLRSGEWRD